MKPGSKRIVCVSSAAAALLLTTVYFLGRAHADGIPAGSGALTYKGTLLDKGVPVEGSRNITVTLFDSETGTNALCMSSSSTSLQAGRFEVQLDASCVTKLRSSPPVWVEVSVDGTALGRTRVSAVPYAVISGVALGTETRVGDAGAQKRYSRSAIFRGTTAGKVSSTGSFNAQGLTGGAISMPGIATGYASAKAACEIAVGSPTAHMCTNEEMVVSGQMDLVTLSATESAWIATGVNEVQTSGVDGGGLHVQRDCRGWTAGTVSCHFNYACFGPLWGAAGPDWDKCDVPHQVACCDEP